MLQEYTTIIYSIVFLIIIYILFIGNLENLEAVMIGNAYTDLACVDDNLPIVRIPKNNGNTFTCASRDGVNCLYRNDYLIPTETVINKNYPGSGRNATTNPISISKVSCLQPPKSISDTEMNTLLSNWTGLDNKKKTDYTNAIIKNMKYKSVNEYLASDGIRGGPSNLTNEFGKDTKTIYNELSSIKRGNNKYPGYFDISCTQNGLNDPNHWCGKVFNKFNEQNCNKSDFENAPYSSVCKTFTDYKNSPALNSDKTISSYITNVSCDPLNKSNIDMCQTKCTRNANLNGRGGLSGEWNKNCQDKCTNPGWVPDDCCNPDNPQLTTLCSNRPI